MIPKPVLATIPIPDNIIKQCSSLITSATVGIRGNEVRQCGEDIFIGRDSVKKHVDSTEGGKDTLVCFIYVKGNYLFKMWHGEKKHPEIMHRDIYTGDVIRFDARHPHALYQLPGEFSGMFAAIIWDVPKAKNIISLGAELKVRLSELTTSYLNTTIVRN